MPTDRPDNLIQRVTDVLEAVDLPDEQLLCRFTDQRDEAAFAALVRRHGPMVLGVCRRVLQDGHDAEDAFQATFLVLAGKARSIANPSLLFHWLHSVAWRTAMEAKTRRARRRAAEWQTARAVAQGPPDPLAWAEIRQVLDEEIGRLPARFRLPFVLCYLDGKTNEEAAAVLECPKGTVVSRLSRAKERLRQRLSRRGLGLTTAALSAILAENAASGKVPAALCASTIKWVFCVGQGRANPAATAAEVAFLARKVVSSMRYSKFKFAAFVILTLAALGTATGLWTLQGGEPAKGAEGLGQPQSAKKQDAAGSPLRGQADPADRDSIQGRWLVTSVSKNGQELTAEEISALLIPDRGVPRPKGPKGFPKGKGGMGPGGQDDFPPLRGDGKNPPVLVITNNEIVFLTPNQGAWVANYQVDSKKKPAWFDLTRRGENETAKGIYRLEGEGEGEGDKLLIVLGEKGSAERPSKFASEPNANHELWVLRREKVPEITAKFQGNWKLVQVGLNGTLRGDNGGDHGTMTITANNMVLQASDDVSFTGVFRLDPDHQPGWIDFQDTSMANTGPLMGSYILEDDSLSIVLKYGKRATNFVAEYNTFFLYLRRVENLTAELLGQWRLTSAQEGGKRSRLLAPNAPIPLLTVTADKLTLTADGKALLEAKWRADPLKKPKWIDLTDMDQQRQMLGLYYVTPDGGLSLVFDKSGLKGRPSGFSSELGTANDVLWYFERLPEGGKKSSSGKGGANGKAKETTKEVKDSERPRVPGAAANAATAALLKKLESADPDARTAALKELHPLAARVDRAFGKLAQGGALHEPKIAGLTPSLAKAAVDPVESIRLSALYALADSRDAEGAAALRDRVSDPSKKVRFTAACLLTEFHDASGLDELRKALTAFQAHLATTPLVEVEQVLLALQRITGKTFGEIPALPPEGSSSAAVAAQYQRLLDTWAAWWDWVPPTK